MSVTITHCGGAQEVGATSYVVEAMGVRFLVDAGMRPDNSKARSDADLIPDWSNLGTLEFALITHAHHDHIGALPVLKQRYPGLPVYATPQTRDVTQIALDDALQIMYKRSDVEDYKPLYFRRDANAVYEDLLELPVGQQVVRDVGGTRVEITPRHAGHIIGAVSYQVRLQSATGVEVRLLLMGDVSAEGVIATMHAFETTAHVRFRPHVVVTESTYGMEAIPSIDDERERFRQLVVEHFLRHGRILIPCFAIGRAQELAYWMGEWNDRWHRWKLRHGFLAGSEPALDDPFVLNALRTEPMLPAVPCLIDGMARPVSDLFEAHPEALNSRLQARYKERGCVLVGHPDMGVLKVTGRLNSKILQGPAVVLAPSGMAVGGRIVDWVEKYGADPLTLIAFQGYTDCETPGGQLRAMAASNSTHKVLRARNKERTGWVEYPVNGPVVAYRMRAHMSGEELVNALFQIQPQHIVVAHGDVPHGRAVTEALRKTLGLAATDVQFPPNGEAVVFSVRADTVTPQDALPTVRPAQVTEQYARGTSAAAIYRHMRTDVARVFDARDIATGVFGLPTSATGRRIGTDLVLEVLDIYQDVYFTSVKEFAQTLFRAMGPNKLPNPARFAASRHAGDFDPWLDVPSAQIQPGIALVRHLHIYPRVALLGPAINDDEVEAIVAFSPATRVRRADVLARVADFPVPSVRWWEDRERWDSAMRSTVSALYLEARRRRAAHRNARESLVTERTARLVCFDDAARALTRTNMSTEGRELLTLLAVTMAWLSEPSPVISLTVDAMTEYLRMPPRRQADTDLHGWHVRLMQPVNEVRTALGMVAAPVTDTEVWPFVVTPLWEQLGADVFPAGPVASARDPMDQLTAALVDAEILTHATAHVHLQAALSTLR